MKAKIGTITHDLRQGTSGLFSTVWFSELTPEQLEYCKLCARTNFHQLVVMANYINKGLTFDQARLNYLKP